MMYHGAASSSSSRCDTRDLPKARGSLSRWFADFISDFDAGLVDPRELSPTNELPESPVKTAAKPPEEPPAKPHRCCALCRNVKYINELLLDLSGEGEGDDMAGGSGDWQGELWAYCVGCADHRGMLPGFDTIQGGNREALYKAAFKREARRRWKRRGVIKMNKNRMLRARNYEQARRMYEAEHPGQSRRSQAAFVRLSVMANRLAADINGMIPARRREAEDALMEYRINCEAEQEDSQATQASMMTASHSPSQQQAPACPARQCLATSDCRRTLGLCPR